MKVKNIQPRYIKVVGTSGESFVVQPVSNCLYIAPIPTGSTSGSFKMIPVRHDITKLVGYRDDIAYLGTIIETLYRTGEPVDYTFGYRLIVSADDSTIVVQSRSGNFIAIRGGNQYVLATAVDGGETYNSLMDVSDNGERIVIGKPKTGSDGEAYAYNWNGSGYTQFILTYNAAGANEFGGFVAMLGTGNSVLVGAPIANNYLGHIERFDWTGAAYVYSGITDGTAMDSQLGRVAVVANDFSAIYNCNRNDYSIEVYTLIGYDSTIPTTASFSEQQDWITLSSDNTTLAIGSTEEDNFDGAVWVGKVNQVTPFTKISPSKNLGDNTFTLFGSAVALNSDGTKLIASSVLNNKSSGSVWLFTSASGNWTDAVEQSIVEPGDISAYNSTEIPLTSPYNALYGFALSFDSTGDNIWVGAYGSDGSGLVNQDTGAVYKIRLN